MSDMIQRYEEEAEAFYQATGVMAPGKDVSAAMHGYDADELRHKLWRMWARAVRAERILAALREPSDPLIDKLCDVHEVETETERCFVVGVIRMAVAAAEREVDA